MVENTLIPSHDRFQEQDTDVQERLPAFMNKLDNLHASYFPSPSESTVQDTLSCTIYQDQEPIQLDIHCISQAFSLDIAEDDCILDISPQKATIRSKQKVTGLPINNAGVVTGCHYAVVPAWERAATPDDLGIYEQLLHEMSQVPTAYVTSRVSSFRG